MVEVVFGSSASGSLKLAQHCGQGRCPAGSAVVFLSEEGREPTRRALWSAKKRAQAHIRQEWTRAVPLGGNPQDVYGLTLALSTGPISESTPGPQRLRVLQQLAGVSDPDSADRYARETLQTSAEALDTVRHRAARGEAVRVWYSDSPDDACGLCWFLSQLHQLGHPLGPVWLVKLPDWEQDGRGTLLRHNGWGEVSPGAWGRYTAQQQAASPVFLQACAARWQTLQAENAPLRAVLNGRLVSAPETLYDSFIAREIAASDEQFGQAQLICLVLGKYQLGIGDAWIALRIEEMIRAGQLAAVTQAAPGEPVYRRILKKL